MKEIFAIDNIVEKLEKSSVISGIIEYDSKYKDTSLCDILSDIARESETLSKNWKGGYKHSNVVLISRGKPISETSRLRKIDRKLEKIPVYKTSIRPFFKDVYKKNLNRARVSVRDLTKYENEEFIRVAYTNILMRQPEDTAIVECQKFLFLRGHTKIDLLCQIADSEEAKLHNVYIKGLKVRRCVRKVKWCLRHFPILGYLMRILINIIYGPKRMQNLQAENRSLKWQLNECMVQIKELERRMK